MKIIADVLTGSMMYVPDTALIQDVDDGTEGADGRKKSFSVAEDAAPAAASPSSHVVITTTKVKIRFFHCIMDILYELSLCNRILF